MDAVAPIRPAFHDAVQNLSGSTTIKQTLVERSLGYLDGLSQEAAGDPGLQLELAEGYIRLGDNQGNPYFQNVNQPEGALASYEKARVIAASSSPSSTFSRISPSST